MSIRRTRGCLNPQSCGFIAAVFAAILMVWSVLWLRFLWALTWLAAVVGLWMLTRHWNRKKPIPFPYAFRWFLRLPRPSQSRDLIRILQPRRGERVLEIGPGLGTHALSVASGLSPGGFLDVVDVQHIMVRTVVRHAREQGITNVNGCTADAARLPYLDQAFDGAYLITVLGEIPDRDAALRELFRILKRSGRLVVGELLVDPDFVSSRHLQGQAERAGFVFHSKTGGPAAYLARFERIG